MNPTVPGVRPGQLLRRCVDNKKQWWAWFRDSANSATLWAEPDELVLVLSTWESAPSTHIISVEALRLGEVVIATGSKAEWQEGWEVV